MTTLQKLADRMIAHARREYAKGEEQLTAFIHIENDAGDGAIVPLPWKDEDDKVRMLRTLRNFFRDSKVRRYALMSEAWVAFYNPDEDFTHRPPREREDRMEVVNIVAADTDGNLFCVSYKIERDAKGKPFVGELMPIPEGFQTGRMTELLR